MSLDYKTFIADDDAMTRHFLSSKVSALGIDATVFDNGISLWQEIEKTTVPYLAIVDWQMPGLSGLKITRLAKDPTRGVFSYIIMVTGRSAIEDTEEAYAAGVDDFLQKPLDPYVLRSRIQVADRIITYETEAAVYRNYLQMHAAQMEELADERAKKLIDADKLVTLGTMASGIAHEINNPTSFISGNVQTLEKFWPTIDEVLESFDQKSDQLNFIREETPRIIHGIKDGVRRISEIVKSSKSYAHSSNAEEQSVCTVQEIVEHSLALTQGNLSKDTVLQVDIDAELPRISALRNKLEQVLVNLIVNASHAVREIPDQLLQIRAKGGVGTVIIEIEDNGTGIPDNLKEKIWTPFFTTKSVDEGTGLGLHICRDIISAHNGSIEVKDGHDKGACFTITLPAITDNS